MRNIVSRKVEGSKVVMTQMWPEGFNIDENPNFYENMDQVVSPIGKRLFSHVTPPGA